MTTNLAIDLVTVKAAQAVQVSSSSIWGDLNPNLIISVFAICLTAFGTFVKIFGTSIKNNRPGYNPQCLWHLKLIENMSKTIEDFKKEQDASHDKADQIIASLRTEVATLKVKVENTNKSVDELRTDTREVAQRLDELLRQLVDWVNQ